MPPSTKQYGSRWAQAGQGEDLTTPSGETCRAIRPGAEGLLRAGVLDKADILTPMVVAMVEKSQGKNVSAEDVMPDLQKVLAEPGKLQEMMSMIDNVAVYVVVEPKVLPVPVVCAGCGEATEAAHKNYVENMGGDHPFNLQPVAPADREPGVYVDYIDMEDKMFLFNYAVGGTRDLAQFRQESELAVAALPAGQATKRPAKRTPRPRK